MFHSDHIKTGGNLYSKPLCITSKNCLLYESVHQNCPEPSPNHVENVQNIDILSFLKTFYDRHCAPYKWIFFGIWYWIRLSSHSLQKIPYSVCVMSTWISVINMRICNVLLNFFVSVYLYMHTNIRILFFKRELGNSYIRHHIWSAVIVCWAWRGCHSCGPVDWSLD